jgi:uncharacterized protein
VSPSESTLLVNAAVLLRVAGTSQHVVHQVEAADVDAGHPALTGPVALDVVLASTLDDIVVTGTLDIPWAGACRRCLRPLADTWRVEVDEHYAENPALVAGGDAFPIVGGRLDLADIVRDEVLLAVAVEPLCRPDCAGLCPVCGRDRNETTCDHDAAPIDDRWAALDQLRDE